MKIKDVKCEVYLKERLKSPPTTGGGRPPLVSKAQLAVLRITTDEGVEGIGSSGEQVNESVVDVIRSELTGKDPLDREWIWKRFWRQRLYIAGIETLAAIDIALWDIAGKALGQPVYKLMGGYRDKIKVYASSYGKLTVQEYVDEVISLKKQGITAYKTHTFRAIPEEDIEMCRAVRQAGGDDMILMHDPAGRYNRDQALQVGKVLEELNYHWYEVPVQDYDIEGLVMLREKLHIPIAATERIPVGMYNIPEYLLRRACDIVRCDTRLDGGITPCKKIADACDMFGMQCELHTFIETRGRVQNLHCGVPNLHVQCAIQNSGFYEMAWPEDRYGLKEYPVLDKEGYIHVPQKPGLGVEIDWEELGELAATY